MLRIAALLFFVFSFSAAVCPQSGRKIAPTPTPEPALGEVPAEQTFSESTPRPKRSMAARPDLRGVKKSEPKAQPRADDKTEILGDSEDDVLKIDTSLITIPVSVFDRNGLYIPNLSQSDFKIFEDGKEQEIAYFGAAEKPFTVVLLIDTSPSTEFKIDEIQNAAIAFVDLLKPQDQVMVIEFDANVHVLTEATGDRQKIYKAIKKADFGGGTSLYDAVEFSLRKRLGRIEGRKAIVLFTDGVDTTSYKSSYKSTLRDAEEADALIFPIYYNTYFDNLRQNGGIFSPFPNRSGGTSSREYALGREYLRDLSESTGGRVFDAENADGGLNAAFEGIAEELRRQYSIGYYPQDPGQAGDRKQIKVRVARPNLVVRARDNYIVGLQRPAAKTDAPKPK